MFKEAFELFDTDGTGAIDCRELKFCCKVRQCRSQNPPHSRPYNVWCTPAQALGMEVGPEEVHQMLVDIDVDGDATIEFEEFVRLLSGHLVSSASNPSTPHHTVQFSKSRPNLCPRPSVTVFAEPSVVPSLSVVVAGRGQDEGDIGEGGIPLLRQGSIREDHTQKPQGYPPLLPRTALAQYPEDAEDNELLNQWGVWCVLTRCCLPACLPALCARRRWPRILGPQWAMRGSCVRTSRSSSRC